MIFSLSVRLMKMTEINENIGNLTRKTENEKESNVSLELEGKKRKPTQQNKPNNPISEIRKSLDVLKRKWR